MRVSIVYADPIRQVVREIEMEADATVGEAVRVSGILDELVGFEPAAFGIFGNKVARDTRLRDGDRVELYRSLKIDPKEARRFRAKK